ncbi:multiubiquitin domain-containing protein [Zhongshania marina]|uniref:Multi-ubiquitin domain-containing protein n=1 Tax=Zhongshania marina TaxID=2304603 RepID=A0ABX9W4G5_9GAMM|nr:hypothetical protein D0911_08645 [Zhongshania marina]
MSHHHSIRIFINKQKFELDNSVQTGASLKQLAGISLQDVLFLQSHGDDEVIANDSEITLKNGSHLHSQPPADYGFGSADLGDEGIDCSRAAFHEQPNGWSFLVISDYKLPEGFEPNQVDLLIKLPPAFPDAQPDMFWVHPPVKTSAGTLPQSTCNENLLGGNWQRFSWHLKPGAWQPGISTLRDFMRCIAARFLRKN